jgi:methylated-DNA-[protein]-cysteine S-methyltransferase
VGQALKRNPLPIILPCHRIVASDGSLGGFSCGVDIKEWLLRHEGAI